MSTAATIPMKWSEIDKYSGQLDRCACCGKKIKGKSRWVEVIDGGSSVAAPGLGADQSDTGYMGFFPIGPSCARQHFPGFTHADIGHAP